MPTCPWARARSTTRPSCGPRRRPAPRCTSWRGSSSSDLGQVVEVAVAGAEPEIVLQGQGGDPEVVGRDRRALAAELTEDGRVLVGRLIVGEQDGDTGFRQEAA